MAVVNVNACPPALCCADIVQPVALEFMPLMVTLADWLKPWAVRAARVAQSTGA